MIHRLWEHRELTLEMARRHVRAMYVGSALGAFWTVVQPFCMLVVYTLVFGLIMRVRLGAEDVGPWFYGLKLCAALLPWQVFVDGFHRGTGALVDNAHLLRKSVFPGEILAVSLALSGAIQFALTMALYLVLQALLAGLGLVPFTLSAWVLAAPLVFVLQLLFTVGLSWVTGSLHAFFRDTAPLVSTLTTIWFFGSPIVYNPEYLDSWKSVPMWIRQLYAINPWYRFAELYQSTLMGFPPRPVTVLVVCIWTAGALVAGALVFDRMRKDMVDVI